MSWRSLLFTPSLEDAAAKYFHDRELRRAPYGVMKEKAVVRTLRQYFDRLPISQEDLLSHAKTRIADGISNRTVDIELGLLSRICRHNGVDIRWKRLPKKPVRRIRILRPFEKRRLLLVAYSKPRWKYSRLMLQFIWNTGMRIGEVHQLHWDDVEMRGRILHVTESKTVHGKGRIIPINEVLENVLLELAEDRVNHLVFPVSRIMTAWYSMCKAAKIKGYSPHMGRHQVATELLSSPDVSPETVRQLLGWKDFAMFNTYAHIVLSFKRQAVDLLCNSRYTLPTSEDVSPTPKKQRIKRMAAHDDDWLPPRDSNPDMLIQSQNAVCGGRKLLTPRDLMARLSEHNPSMKVRYGSHSRKSIAA